MTDGDAGRMPKGRLSSSAVGSASVGFGETSARPPGRRLISEASSRPGPPPRRGSATVHGERRSADQDLLRRTIRSRCRTGYRTKRRTVDFPVLRSSEPGRCQVRNRRKLVRARQAVAQPPLNSDLAKRAPSPSTRYPSSFPASRSQPAPDRFRRFARRPPPARAKPAALASPESSPSNRSSRPVYPAEVRGHGNEARSRLRWMLRSQEIRTSGRCARGAKSSARAARIRTIGGP